MVTDQRASREGGGPSGVLVQASKSTTGQQRVRIAQGYYGGRGLAKTHTAPEAITRRRPRHRRGRGRCWPVMAQPNPIAKEVFETETPTVWSSPAPSFDAGAEGCWRLGPGPYDLLWIGAPVHPCVAALAATQARQTLPAYDCPDTPRLVFAPIVPGAAQHAPKRVWTRIADRHSRADAKRRGLQRFRRWAARDSRRSPRSVRGDAGRGARARPDRPALPP